MKKLLSAFLSLILIILMVSPCFNAFAGDIRFSSKSKLERFTDDVMDLIYSNGKSTGAVSLMSSPYPQKENGEETEAEKASEEQRLINHRSQANARVIVKSEKSVDSFGAVKTAEGYDDLHVFQFSSEEEANRALEYYKTLDYVEYAEKDSMFSARSVDADGVKAASAVENPMADITELVGITALQNYFSENNTVYDEEITVAVLDSGAESTHELLKDRLVENDFNSVGGTGTQDDNGHGTHVAGIVVSNTLDNVKVKPYKVLNSECDGTELEVTLGIEQAVEDGVDVINMSIGGRTNSELMHDAVKKAYEKNIPVVVSAGNDFADISKFYYSPACFPECITVMSCGKNMIGVPGFSNYGGECDIAAPGVSIKSSYLGNTYKELSGTSQSSPFVAAAVTYLLLENNALSVTQIKEKLQEYTVPFGFKTKNSIVESGNVGCLYMEYITRDIETASSPVFSRESGGFTEGFKLTLNSDDLDATIYYHTSNMPDYYNRQYNSPISIQYDTSITAWAYKDGMKISKEATAEYTKEYPDDDSKYEISNTGEIKKYIADEEDVVVPKTVNGIEVKSIGYAAFANKQMKSAIMPDTVESIDDAAFSNCASLDYVRANGVSITGSSFMNCTNLQTIECDNLKVVGERAFQNCDSLKFFDFSNIQSIGHEAFSSASGFYSIVSDELTQVDVGAFQNTQIVVFDAPNVTALGDNAFQNCTSLKTVKIPGVTTIKKYTFYGDAELSKIEADDVRIMDKASFSGCKSLRFASFPNLKYIDYSSLESSGSTFAGCTSLAYFDAENVVDMGLNTFSNCTSLQSISLPNLEKMGAKAFTNCTSLTDVYLPKLKTLPLNAFNGCTSLKELEFQNAESTRKSNDQSDLMKVNFLILDKAATVAVLPNNSGVLLPSTVTRITASVPENTVIYATKGTFAYNWAVNNGLEVKEITQETALITDLPMKYNPRNGDLVADVIGFNRTYQWYGNDEADNTTGTAIDGETKKSLDPNNYSYPYYYCVVKSTDTGKEPVEIRTGAAKGPDAYADYTALSALIQSVPDDLSVYTEESVAKLNEALNSINYELEADLQDVVDGYFEAVSDALNSLEYKPADYTNYNNAVKKAQDAVNSGLYDDLGALESALSVDVSGKKIIEQSVVDAQANAILSAIDMLKYKSADYTEYIEAVAKANGLDLTLYKNSDELSKVLSVNVNGLDITEQERVDNQVKAILEAIDALVYKDADYTQYLAAVTKANAVNRSLYKDVSDLNLALSVDVSGKNITKQSEVDKQTKAILDAIDALQYKTADYSRLNSALEKVPDDLSVYTKESVDNLNSVINSLEYNLDITKQDYVDKQANALLGAIDSLERSFIAGDVNCDGKITIVDAKWILQHLSFLRTLDGVGERAADVNQDKRISVADAKRILQIIASAK